MKQKNKLLKFFIILIMLKSCSNPDDQKFLGQIVGAAVGGYVGSKVGSGVTKDLAIIFGGAAGYLIGGKIVNILNDNDKKAFNKEIEKSLEEDKDNFTREWESSQDNAKANITPLNKYEINKQTCRDFQKIIQKNGKTFEETSTACRDQSGNWKLI